MIRVFGLNEKPISQVIPLNDVENHVGLDPTTPHYLHFLADAEKKDGTVKRGFKKLKDKRWFPLVDSCEYAVLLELLKDGEIPPKRVVEYAHYAVDQLNLISQMTDQRKDILSHYIPRFPSHLRLRKGQQGYVEAASRLDAIPTPTPEPSQPRAEESEHDEGEEGELSIGTDGVKSATSSLSTDRVSNITQKDVREGRKTDQELIEAKLHKYVNTFGFSRRIHAKKNVPLIHPLFVQADHLGLIYCFMDGSTDPSRFKGEQQLRKRKKPKKEKNTKPIPEELKNLQSTMEETKWKEMMENWYTIWTNWSGKYELQGDKVEGWCTLSGTALPGRGEIIPGSRHDMDFFNGMFMEPFMHLVRELFGGDAGYQNASHICCACKDKGEGGSGREKDPLCVVNAGLHEVCIVDPEILGELRGKPLEEDERKSLQMFLGRVRALQDKRRWMQMKHWMKEHGFEDGQKELIPDPNEGMPKGILRLNTRILTHGEFWNKLLGKYRSRVERLFGHWFKYRMWKDNTKTRPQATRAMRVIILLEHLFHWERVSQRVNPRLRKAAEAVLGFSFDPNDETGRNRWRIGKHPYPEDLTNPNLRTDFDFVQSYPEKDKCTCRAAKRPDFREEGERKKKKDVLVTCPQEARWDITKNNVKQGLLPPKKWVRRKGEMTDETRYRTFTGIQIAPFLNDAELFGDGRKRTLEDYMKPLDVVEWWDFVFDRPGEHVDSGEADHGYKMPKWKNPTWWGKDYVEVSEEQKQRFDQIASYWETRNDEDSDGDEGSDESSDASDVSSSYMSSSDEEDSSENDDSSLETSDFSTSDLSPSSADDSSD